MDREEGMIHCTGIPTGALRTDRPYENFILEFEWRHLVAAGNAGLFVWAEPISAPGVPFLRPLKSKYSIMPMGSPTGLPPMEISFPFMGRP